MVIDCSAKPTRTTEAAELPAAERVARRAVSLGALRTTARFLTAVIFFMAMLALFTEHAIPPFI
jgi:hypothetical protein